MNYENNKIELILKFSEPFYNTEIIKQENKEIIKEKRNNNNNNNNNNKDIKDDIKEGYKIKEKKQQEGIGNIGNIEKEGNNNNNKRYEIFQLYNNNNNNNSSQILENQIKLENYQSYNNNNNNDNNKNKNINQLEDELIESFLCWGTNPCFGLIKDEEVMKYFLNSSEIIKLQDILFEDNNINNNINNINNNHNILPIENTSHSSIPPSHSLTVDIQSVQLPPTSSYFSPNSRPNKRLPSPSTSSTLPRKYFKMKKFKNGTDDDNSDDHNHDIESEESYEYQHKNQNDDYDTTSSDTN